MPERKDVEPSPDQETSIELSWLQENLSTLWLVAHFHYEISGRGALVIDAYSEPLGDDPRCYYSPHAQIAEQQMEWQDEGGCKDQ